MTPKEKPREERMTSDDMARSHCGEECVSIAREYGWSKSRALEGGHAKGWWKGSGYAREVWRCFVGGSRSSGSQGFRYFEGVHHILFHLIELRKLVCLVSGEVAQEQELQPAAWCPPCLERLNQESVGRE